MSSTSSYGISIGAACKNSERKHKYVQALTSLGYASTIKKIGIMLKTETEHQQGKDYLHQVELAHIPMINRQLYP